MTNLHLIVGAVLEAAKAGGLKQPHAESLFHRLSGYLDDVPGEVIGFAIERLFAAGGLA